MNLDPNGRGNALAEKVKTVHSAEWRMSTNLLAALDLILDTATGAKDMFGRGRVSEEEMPQVLWVLSDMQFDACVQTDGSTWDKVKAKYARAGYKVPTVIFWNLSGQFMDFPVTVDNGYNTCLLSGFSVDTLKSVMVDPILDPLKTVRRVIDDERYDAVRKAVVPIFSQE